MKKKIFMSRVRFEVFLIMAVALICPVSYTGCSEFSVVGNIDAPSLVDGGESSTDVEDNAIHVYPNDRAIRNALDSMKAGDTLVLHAGTYHESIDTYDGPVLGGTSWDTKTTIRAHVTNGVADKVILRPLSGQFALRLATAQASYIEFRDIEIDASGVSLDAVKLTYSGTDPSNQSHHVRFLRCDIHHSKTQGALVFGHHHEFIDCSIHENGTTTLDHGMYIPGDNNLVRGCRIWGNAGYGVHIYDGTGQLTAHHNQILESVTYDNIHRAGILIASGVGNVARQNISRNNQFGVHIYFDSVDAIVENNVFCGNTDAPIYVDPAATGTLLNQNYMDPACL